MNFYSSPPTATIATSAKIVVGMASSLLYVTPSVADVRLLMLSIPEFLLRLVEYFTQVRMIPVVHPSIQPGMSSCS